MKLTLTQEFLTTPIGPSVCKALQGNKLTSGGVFTDRYFCCAFNGEFITSEKLYCGSLLGTKTDNWRNTSVTFNTEELTVDVTCLAYFPQFKINLLIFLNGNDTPDFEEAAQWLSEQVGVGVNE